MYSFETVSFIEMLMLYIEKAPRCDIVIKGPALGGPWGRG